MKFFKSFDEFNNWNYEQCGLKLIDVFTKTGSNFVVLDRISSSYYCNPKYFETDIDAKIYAKENCVFQRVVIMLLNMEQYIASYKHLIGCEYKSKYNDLVWFCSEKTAIDVLEEPWRLSSALFWIDNETLGTYKEYMQLHYPKYAHIWSKQLRLLKCQKI